MAERLTPNFRYLLEILIKEYHSLHALPPYNLQTFERCESTMCSEMRAALRAESPSGLPSDTGEAEVHQAAKIRLDMEFKRGFDEGFRRAKAESPSEPTAAPATPPDAEVTCMECGAINQIWGKIPDTLKCGKCSKTIVPFPLPPPERATRTAERCNCGEPVICPIHSKLCSICNQYIPVRETYHSNDDHTVFYHEVCSYQKVIEDLRSELAALRPGETR